MTIPKALEIKEELEEIDRLLKQLEEAAKTAQIGVIDMEALAEFAEPGDIEKLNELAEQIEQYLRDLAERQGLEKTAQGYQLTPKAYRLFQGRLLERIFSNLEASRTGRHQGPVVGEGAVEMQQTKPYEFGDSLANMDIPGSLVNAMVRQGPGLPIRLRPDDIEIHRTRNTPKCATAVLLDMSGSMRYDGLYVNVKRMGLALDGLIRREYPGDWLQFIEVYTFAKPRQPGEIVTLLPKPVTIFDPVVRLRADMSDERLSEMQIPAALHQHPARPATGPADAGGPGHAQPADHPDHRRPADGAFRGAAPLPALSARPADRGGHDARGAALPARGDHDQHLPLAELVAVERGRAVRPSAFGIDRRPGLLHRRQGPGPLRGLGLSEAAAGDRGVKGTPCPGVFTRCQAPDA